jgi:uncharacterized protein YnzC (UPF0291/DUF896 family)
MPRGSKPGERRGGRRRGTPNKKTALKSAAIAAAAHNPDISPLEFLLGVMRDPNVSPDLRVKVAQAAAPFVHPRPASGSSDSAASAKLIETIGGFTIDAVVAKALRDDDKRVYELGQKEFRGPLSAAEIKEQSELRERIADRAKAIGCPVGYGSRQFRIDRDRLHTFFCKRLSHPSKTLTEAEDAEEAQLTARVLAYQESPEGRALRRVSVLTLKNYSRSGLSAAEQSELDGLRKLYLSEPPDPNDPLSKDSNCD